MRGIELTPEYPVQDIIEFGQAASRAGFDTAFISCHYNNRDPMVVLGQLAADTPLRIGPGVINPYQTHPVVLASQVATLAEVTDGRAIFGIGAGDRSTLGNLGVHRDQPLRRVLETVQVARQLWAGERINHDGTFTANDAQLNYDVPWPIPVYVGAQGPHMLRMTAKHADGALVNAAHPRDFDWATDQLQIGRDKRVLDSPLDVAAYASVSIAEDAESARDAARPPVAYIVGGASEQVLDRHGIDVNRANRIGELVGAGQFRDAFDAVTDPMLEAFCVTGTPDRVGERVDAILEYTDSFVAGSPLGPDPKESIRLLGRVLDSTPV